VVDLQEAAGKDLSMCTWRHFIFVFLRYFLIATNIQNISKRTEGLLESPCFLCFFG
jgi:hypothetical protein